MHSRIVFVHQVANGEEYIYPIDMQTKLEVSWSDLTRLESNYQDFYSSLNSIPLYQFYLSTYNVAVEQPSQESLTLYR